MPLIEKYANMNYSSYEDFHENFKINVPDNFNFGYDVIDELAKNTPDAPALVWCNTTGDKKTFTFSDIKQHSDKTANMLLNIGIQKGDPIMLILKRNYEFWSCIIALHKIGAIAIPATHLLTKKDIVYRNNAANIKMIIATDQCDVAEYIDEAQSETPSLTLKMMVGGQREGWLNYYEELDKADDILIKPESSKLPKNDDIMLLYFTSGTTGFPKMVRHNFTYPLGHITTAAFWQNVRPGKLHLTIADTGWAKSVWGKLYGQWLMEAVVFVYDYDRFVPSEMLKIISENKVATFCAPPTMYRFLLQEDFEKYDLSNLEYCCIAGEPLNPEIYYQFLKKTGIKLREGFGQTETSVSIATFPWLDPKPGSMGKPAPSYVIDILDPEGNSCDIGEEGELVYLTDKCMPYGIFDGYYKDESRTESVWSNGIYYTGDIVWKDEDDFLWYVGRSDDVIKSSGYRIGPFEVESALLEHPAVVETAITGVPDPLRGQIVKASVILAQNYLPSEELKKELQDYVKKVTAPYKYPRIIEFVDELPKTISGKIRRVQIREQDS